MRGISKRCRRFHAVRKALISFYLLAGLSLLPASAFCADANTQEIVEQAAEKAAEKAVEKPQSKPRPKSLKRPQTGP